MNTNTGRTAAAKIAIVGAVPLCSKATAARRRCFRFLATFFVLGWMCSATQANAKTACVWKVTRQDGKIAYLGGSIHALRKSDYPLPAAYSHAFDASSHMAFEVDASGLRESSLSLVKKGKYPRGDNLARHIDPRLYAYLRRLMGLMHVSEKTFSQYRPWFIVLTLQSTALHQSRPEIGVDEFLMKQALRRSMPVAGLENVEEHARVYAGLNDRESEILLLVTLMPSNDSGDEARMMKAWRRGDAEALAAITRRNSNGFPAFNERLLTARNRAWVPRIERFIRSGHVYFVVVGAGHFGGSNGLLALLRAKGYRIEQL